MTKVSDAFKASDIDTEKELKKTPYFCGMQKSQKGVSNAAMKAALRNIEELTERLATEQNKHSITRAEARVLRRTNKRLNEAVFDWKGKLKKSKEQSKSLKKRNLELENGKKAKGHQYST